MNHYYNLTKHLDRFFIFFSLIFIYPFLFYEYSSFLVIAKHTPFMMPNFNPENFFNLINHMS